MCVCVCGFKKLINKTVSPHHNTLVWVGTQDSRNWDRNSAESHAKVCFYRTATKNLA